MKIKNGKLLGEKVQAALKIAVGILVVLFFGICCIALADMYFSGEAEPLAGFCVCLLFVIGGIFLISRGAKQNKLIANCKCYAAVMASYSILPIDQLAGTVGQPAGAVRANLEKMIKRGYFDGIYLDYAKGCIVSKAVHSPVTYVEGAGKVGQVAACTSSDI